MTFPEFQSSCLFVLSQSQNCAESQAVFRSATNVSELAQALRRYINGVIHEVPAQVVSFLSEHYLTYRTEISAADVYFNETSPTGTGIVIAGDMPDTDASHPLVIDSNMPQPVHVYVLGAAYVEVRGHVHIYCDNAAAHITLRHHTRGTVIRGHSTAYDRTHLTTYGPYEAHNFAKVIASHP